MRICFCFLGLALLLSSPAAAFKPVEGSDGAGDCKSCHTLSKEEARKIFKGFQGDVASVGFADVPGLWEIEMKVQGKNVPLYLDFSKSYLVSGNIIRLKDRKNLTEERYRQLNPVDLSRIPTSDVLLLGNPAAENKIIVFTDPHCPYCSKLHKELQQAVEKRSDLLFQIKLMPIKPSSRKISETIVCNNSMEQLEAAFAGKAIPDTDCETGVIEQNLALARSLGIRSTPTLVLPNGQIAPGYKALTVLLDLIDQNLVAQKNQSEP